MQAQVDSKLQQAKRFATIALALAAAAWIVLMALAQIFPQYAWLIHILMLAAEAGVVGGMADWYAITVLFRNPFGKLPLPKLLRQHTEIIPRNKARIADSMGRFVQENFLSPSIVANSLAQTDLSLMAANWLAQSKNSQKIVEALQLCLPKFFAFFGKAEIRQFMQDNGVEWMQNTKINRMAAELLRAIVHNDFHQAVLQRALDSVQRWIKQHPEQSTKIAERLFDEMGMAALAKGVRFIGIDMKQRTIKSFLQKIELLLADPQHPWRIQLEQQALGLMQQLLQDDSVASLRLNHNKDTLLQSPQLLNFLSAAIQLLSQAISKDLQQANSGLASNLNAVLVQIARSVAENIEVRRTINQRIASLATELSSEYSDKVIGFISQQIHAWDSREMIGKIENSVGADLHMIRVNGVVVGAFIGLLLGIFRALFEAVF